MQTKKSYFGKHEKTADHKLVCSNLLDAARQDARQTGRRLDSTNMCTWFTWLDKTNRQMHRCKLDAANADDLVSQLDNANLTGSQQADDSQHSIAESAKQADRIILALQNVEC